MNGGLSSELQICCLDRVRIEFELNSNGVRVGIVCMNKEFNVVYRG